MTFEEPIYISIVPVLLEETPNKSKFKPVMKCSWPGCFSKRGRSTFSAKWKTQCLNDGLKTVCVTVSIVRFSRATIKRDDSRFVFLMHLKIL